MPDFLEVTLIDSMGEPPRNVHPQLWLDGGKTFRTLPWGGDTHDIWIDPTNADRILVTHDAGMFMTQDHGRPSNRVTLPIGQMYHVAVDNDVPYRIYSNM